ncbi:ATP-NAD kinase-like domain-containing protein [Blastocladiella britannica]|nr:ATP-NAD kinase-like domain-containing protein [Blastocladiella britannica]
MAMPPPLSIPAQTSGRRAPSPFSPFPTKGGGRPRSSSLPSLSFSPTAQQQQQQQGSPRPSTPTHKLAETVVGVREVAKHIGRARVRVSQPSTVMIVTKLHDAALVRLTRDMATWLIDNVVPRSGSRVAVYIDAAIRDHPEFDYGQLARNSDAYAEQIHFWTPQLCADEPEIIDFVVTLGGDGTVLYTSWLFQGVVPPVIPFHLGSLGFLTVFDFARYKHLLKSVFERGARVNLRMRFACTVYSSTPAPDLLDGEDDLESYEDNHDQHHHHHHHHTSTAENPTAAAAELPRRRCESLRNMADMAAVAQAVATTNGKVVTDTSPCASPTDMVAPQQQQVVEPTPISPLSAAFAPMIAQTRRASLSLTPNAMPGAGAKHSSAASSAGAAVSGQAAAAATSSDPWLPPPRTFRHGGLLVTCSTFTVLNELVVDRGPSAYMSQLELFGDERHLTTVQADGLVVSTPTGSTAYSLSAGGSIVHPEVQAVLVTPICPHTLSFRPMLLPDGMEIKVCVPGGSRNTAWASFDGRHRIELKQGDFVSITASKYPFPTICHQDQSRDWFHSLARCLHWNERQRQKAFAPTVPGAGADASTSAARHKKSSSSSSSVGSGSSRHVTTTPATTTANASIIKPAAVRSTGTTNAFNRPLRNPAGSDSSSLAGHGSAGSLSGDESDSEFEHVCDDDDDDDEVDSGPDVATSRRGGGECMDERSHDNDDALPPPPTTTRRSGTPQTGTKSNKL